MVQLPLTLPLTNMSSVNITTGNANGNTTVKNKQKQRDCTLKVFIDCTHNCGIVPGDYKIRAPYPLVVIANEMRR